MDFAQGLIHLKQDSKIRRERWDGVKTWIRLQAKDEEHTMPTPHILMCREDEEPTLWEPSHEDLLANDWQLVESD